MAARSLQPQPDRAVVGLCRTGPAQLALAILADATGDGRVALRLHQRFKFERIATLRQSVGWSMTQASVLAFVHEHADELSDLTKDDD